MSVQLPPPTTLPAMTRTDFVRYQGASGDMNPVHHDEDFAKAAGLPAPLAVGMYAAGALCAWASDALGPDNVRRSRIRWKKMCFPGTVLTFSGEVVAQQSVDGMVQAKVELTATDADGDVAVQAWMDFELPEHP
jgi:acyl dehydratase